MQERGTYIRKYMVNKKEPAEKAVAVIFIYGGLLRPRLERTTKRSRQMTLMLGVYWRNFV